MKSFWLLIAAIALPVSVEAEQLGSTYPALPVIGGAGQVSIAQSDPADVLKKLELPEIAHWYQQQAQISEAALAAMPGRLPLRQRIQDLQQLNGAAAALNCYLSDDSVSIYSQIGADGRSGIYLRLNTTNAERLLYLTDSKQRCKQLWWSPEARQLVIDLVPASAASASGNRQLQLVDAANPELQSSLETGDVSYEQQLFWWKDGDFWYSKVSKAGGREIWRHKRAQGSAEDQPVLAVGQMKLFSKGDDISLIADPDTDLVLLRQLPKNSARPLFYYGHRDAKTGLPGKWEKLAGPEDGVLQAALVQQQLVLLISEKNGQRKLVSLSQKQLQIKSAKPLALQDQAFWLELKAAAGQLYLHGAVGGQSHLYRVSLDGAETELRLPVDGNLQQWVLGRHGDVQSLTMSSLLRAPRSYRSVADQQFEVLASYGQVAQQDYAYQSEPQRIMLKPAGQIDLLTVESSARKPDRHLLVLQSLPSDWPLWQYQPEWQAWLELGGRLSLLNVNDLADRQQVMRALSGSVKTTAATDFQLDSLVQVLKTVKQRDSAQLPLMLQERQPASRLGLLAALRQPELLCALSSTDALSQAPDSVPSAKAASKRLPSVSPPMYAYDQVYAGMAYPATLLLAHQQSGVPVWSSAKMIAALQLLSKSDRPAWLSGQWGKQQSGPTADLNELADSWLFFNQQCGVTAQPAGSSQPASLAEPVSKPRS